VSSGGREISPELRTVYYLTRQPEPRPDDFARRCRAVRAQLTGRATGDPDVIGESPVIPGPDIGPAMAMGLLRPTSRILGMPEGRGGSGMPHQWTALGVFAAIRACVPDLSKARIAVQGSGHVGSRLIPLLVAEGAEVAASDYMPESVAGTGARFVEHDRILDEPCDVFSPNARNAALTVADVDRLDCRFIAGSMHNQVADADTVVRLVERGIRHVPEEVAGSGWLLNMAEELHPDGYDSERARERVMSIETIAMEGLAC
jgi:glutamate dehydrogenase/leucine dehydrogenase